MMMMDWAVLSTQELVDAVRQDPCASERDLVMVEKITTLIDELDALETALIAAQGRKP